MTSEIESAARTRDIRRLCHFAPARNFTHMLADGEIRPTADLRADDSAVLNPTDELRLDGRPDRISCSIEYPNVWYFQKARQKGASAFPTWVILALDPQVLWREGTMFSPRNAAAENGSLIVGGYAGFQSLFASSVQGSRGHTFTRTATMLAASPTDNQAEVLVPGSIPTSLISEVIVPNEAAAREVWVGAQTDGLSDRLPGIAISAAMFDPASVTRSVRSGNRIIGTPWDPDE